ncbi:MAG: tetratricopeptide repeat protein [Candidatus Coprovivens sp.]
MYKFNYSKMNRVIDNVKINLSNLTEIEDIINVFGGALLFFDDALSKAENLDNKLTIDYVNYFYREIFNITLNMNNLEIMKPVSDLLIEKLEKKVGKKKNNPYFNLMIDILILNALSFVQVSMIDGAKIYFDKAIDLGNKYLNDSSKNYHDSLCCACNWLGVIYFRENNSKEALRYLEKTLELYNSVKDMDGFYFKEYNPADVANRIKELKKDISE